MPNIKSAKKSVKVQKKKAIRNKAIKSNMKTIVKKAEEAVVNNAENKEAAVKDAISIIDRAVTKGILHRNNASRKVSQLTKMLKS